MKRAIFVLVALLLVFSSVPAFAGNGAPNGAHYNLNLIGVPNPKNADLSFGSGQRIFIPLKGHVDILLAPGDYDVIDGNGTDGTAKFMLPYPDEDGDGYFDYTVWIRPVAGKGTIAMQSCFTDGTGTWCYAGSLSGGVGKSTKFVDVSKDLLQVCIDPDGDGDFTLEPLFTGTDTGYFWDVVNDGMRLTQMRFYEGAPDYTYGGVCEPAGRLP